MQYIPCLYNKVIVCLSVCMYNILYNTDASNEKGTKEQNMLQCWKVYYFFVEAIKGMARFGRSGIVF